MYVKGQCKKCGHVLWLEIKDNNIEFAKHWVENTQMGECPGFHVEIGTWADYYDFDYNNLYQYPEK